MRRLKGIIGVARERGVGRARVSLGDRQPGREGDLRGHDGVTLSE